jgi:ABC-type Mn2+/Zn2+ transport system permease subunit
MDFTLANFILAALALGVSCGILSVFVVSQRWAFVGEGISHAGLGGAGTAWMLALLFPQLDSPYVPQITVVLFCLLMAMGIGFVTRGRRVSPDAAIGIFLVASLAWGFFAQHLYMQYRTSSPFGFNTYFFGQMQPISRAYLLVALCVMAVVVACVALLNKEIVSYCFDPVMAQVSGVRVGFIHYLLLGLLALAILAAMQVMGSILVTALLVIPGTCATLIATRLRMVMVISVVAALAGVAGGLAIQMRWPFLPAGPAVVLVLLVLFVICYVRGATRRALE